MKASSILVVRPEKLGDLVVATPVFRALKESFPQYSVHLLTDEIFGEVVRHDPHIDRIISIPWKGRDRKWRPSILGIRSFIKSTDYDKALILYPGWEGWNWLCASLCIPHVAQLGGTKSGFVLKHRMILRKNRFKDRHIRDWYLDVANALGAVTSNPDPAVYIEDSEIRNFKLRFPEYSRLAESSLILHLGGSPEGENVSISKLAEWVPQISSSLERPIYVTGTHAEAVEWNSLGELQANRELLGNLSVREMMVAISMAGGVVSNSTGIVHLAAALGRPTLGLYTADPCNSSLIWGPIGKNVICLSPNQVEFQKKKNIHPSGSRVDLGELISVSDVISKLAELLKSGRINTQSIAVI